MEKQELELFLNKRIKLTKKNSGGTVRYFTGFIQQLNINSLLLKDKFGCMVLLAYETIEHIETLKEGDF